MIFSFLSKKEKEKMSINVMSGIYSKHIKFKLGMLQNINTINS